MKTLGQSNKNLTKTHLLNGINNGIIGILFLIFFISLGLVFALYIRPFYYSGMEQISVETGYEISEIKENYDALIDWCNPFVQEKLSFPTLPASESGISHFNEVKVIFNLFFWALIFSPLLLTVMILIQHKRNSFSYLLVSPIIMCVLPFILAIGSAINFERVFVLFHEIVFHNDDWLFSEVADPIILFLPERFFLLCALIIAGTVFLGAFLLLAVYLAKTKKKC